MKGPGARLQVDELIARPDLDADVRESPGDLKSAATSRGAVLSAVGWLDVHFEACRPEYEAMVRSVGIAPGDRVLDVGTGGGSFIPLIADLVGPTGHIEATDAAPENITAVEARLSDWGLPCAVHLQTCEPGALPYGDDSFDVVWCANVLQYFDGPALSQLLAELRRVLRPGGVLAVKDVDMLLARIYPASPFLITHLSEASLAREHVSAQSIGSLRGRELRGLLEGCGFQPVQQRTWLIERWAPLRPREQRLWKEWLAYLAGLAERRPVPAEDLGVWRSLLDADAAEHLVDRPDFYGCEGQVVATGRAPF
jgi:SAM-dependent methyltransferase